MNGRLKAVEDKAARVCTVTEFLQIIRIIFALADRTFSNADETGRFKQETISMLSGQLEIDVPTLRDALL